MNNKEPYLEPGYVETHLLGTITFTEDPIINEAQIGTKPNIKKIGDCKIEVYGSEGSIPHFHIDNKDGSFKSCICIYSNNYFEHGDKYKGKLSSSQLKQLVEWLKDQNEDNPKITNWEAIGLSWNMANPDHKHKYEDKMPNYKNMTNYKRA